MIKWIGIILLAAAVGGFIFFSLTPKEPRVIWQRSLAAIWGCAPAIGTDGTIHFSDIETNVGAIAPDGSVRWKARLPHNSAAQVPFVLSALIGPDRVIYATAASGELFAISREGKLLWTVGGGVPASTLAAVDTSNTIYIGSTNGKLHALDASGASRWTFKAVGDKTGNPVLGADGTIYFGCSAGNLYALNRDGALKWTCTNAARFSSHPIIGPDGTIYVECYPQFHAVRPDGTVRWSRTHHMSGQSAVLNASGTLFICDSNGVLALQAATGKVLWKHRAPDYGLVPSYGLALARDGTIYFCGDRVINGLDSKGRLKWSFRRDPNPDPEAIGVWARIWNRLD